MGLIIKILAHSGFAGIITSLTSILISIYLNPWFDFLKNAFSDLGSDYANYPFVFNYGLVISSIFMFLYAVWLIYSAKNKIETIGSGFIIIDSIFLALIGIFHEGTSPHVFVSFSFFMLADIIIATWGLGKLLYNKKFGLFSILLGIISPVIAFSIKWPSTATVEAFSIAIIYSWTILSYISNVSSIN